MNRYFRKINTHTSSATSSVTEPKYQLMEGSELQILLKDTEKYYKNPLISYLTINNFRNKVVQGRRRVLGSGRTGKERPKAFPQAVGV